MFVNKNRLTKARNSVHQAPRPRANRPDVNRNWLPKQPALDAQSDLASSKGRGSVVERLSWKQEVGSSILLVPNHLSTRGDEDHV